MLVFYGSSYPALCSGSPRFHNSDTTALRNSFSWSKDHPLSWADFQGSVPAGAEQKRAAVTYCGIYFQTNKVTSKERVIVRVESRFEKDSSWVRRSGALPEVLRHEQGHWDLCELYARILQARFDSTVIMGAQMKKSVPRIYHEVLHAYKKRQQDYEQETQHGMLPEAQHRWDLEIAKALSDSSQK